MEFVWATLCRGIQTNKGGSTDLLGVTVEAAIMVGDLPKPDEPPGQAYADLALLVDASFEDVQHGALIHATFDVSFKGELVQKDGDATYAVNSATPRFTDMRRRVVLPLHVEFSVRSEGAYEIRVTMFETTRVVPCQILWIPDFGEPDGGE